MQGNSIRIGTRGSPLALAQAHEVRQRLMDAHGLIREDLEIIVIKTSGDAVLDRSLADIGGKGLFTKEIEEALVAGRIDLAVHSMKDMATELPEGLAIGAVLTREDVRDAFISLEFGSINALPERAIVGTSSLRRQAQLKKLRPDLEIIGFRGNVQTRLEKLDSGKASATILACAGLNRLRLADKITAQIETDIMLPAVAQGAVGIEVRTGDAAANTLVKAVNDPMSASCIAAERAFLKVLDGSCRTPIAGLATINNGTMTFRGETLSPDGCHWLQTERSAPTRNGVRIAEEAAQELLDRGARDLMSQ